MNPSDPPTVALCLEFPIGLRGGVSIVVRALIQNLKDHFRLIVVSTDSEASFRETEPDLEHIHWNHPKPGAKAARELAAELAHRGVQLAHFHFGGNYGWGSRIPGRCPIPHLARLNVPVVSTVHSIVGRLHGYCGPRKPLAFKLATYPIAWMGKNSVLKHVTREIAVSKHDFELLTHWYPAHAKKFQRIYHSRLQETSAPNPESAREKQILNVGHIAFRKGQPVLARAFAIIANDFPDWSLLLCGDVVEPEADSAIRETAAGAGLEDRIRLLDPNDSALDLMVRAGIYAQPSLEEALGLALQEAMFQGCACVASNVGGIPELIDDPALGVLTQPGDERELADNLARLIRDQDARRDLGAAAARSIRERNMTSEAMTRSHIELYESILSQS